MNAPTKNCDNVNMPARNRKNTTNTRSEAQGRECRSRSQFIKRKYAGPMNSESTNRGVRQNFFPLSGSSVTCVCVMINEDARLLFL